MNRIKKIRQDKKIKQKQLAHLLSKTPRQIQRYETDNNSLSVSNAIVIADYLDISLDYLFKRKNYIEKYGKEDFYTEEQVLFNKLDKNNQILAKKLLSLLLEEQERLNK